MSFSSTVKNELCRLEMNGKCCLLAELISVIKISGTINKTENSQPSIRIVTENAAFARRLFSNVRKVKNVHPEVIIRKGRKFKKHVSYIIILTASEDIWNMLRKTSTFQEDGNSEMKKILENNCCRRTYLRGAFLASGSISDPEKAYHLEITTHKREHAEEINMLMASFNLNSKIIKRKGYYVVYLKEGENIIDFLNIIGAHTALLELENIRILKEMRNNVNRIVNCETANLDKTVNASLRQIENIEYIRDNIGFDKLPEPLREIAELRLKHSDASLRELGEKLNPPLGKSGVNHRLRKLEQIAEDARTKATFR